MACRASGLHFPTFDGSSYSGKVSNLSIHPGFLHHMMALPARHPMIRKSIKRAKNIPNSIFAIPAAAPAIPPNPRAAAIMETTKKTIAQYSINASFRQKSADRHFSLVRVERTTLAKLACGPQADARTSPSANRTTLRNNFTSMLVLFQNSVEFLDVGRFWKVVIETGFFIYCLVRLGPVTGNGN